LITKVRGDALAGIDANCYHNVLVQEAMASMKRLCADYLDGLLYHNPQYVFDPCAMEALVNLRHAGHINSVGVSVYTPDEVAAALQYDIDIVQAPYSVFDRRLDSTGFFKKAQECNVMVMARSVLLQGLLAMPEVPATMSFAEPYIKDFCETCGQLQLSPLEGAVGFAASHPHINCLLFGVDNKRQLDEVMNAAQKQMNHAVYEKLKCRFTNIPERVYMPRQWPKGD
jgi:aryl-alcohol dehydrogenase-like predicted oxidoreductase